MAFETDQKISFLETIHTIYPGIDIRSARQLTHDGEFNDIFIINDELVFRFPRFPENIPDFLREMELLTRLQGRLPLPIPNPIYTSSAPEKVCMGYRLIPGQPLQPDLMNRITNEAIIQGLAKQLADFLFILHHLTPGTLGLDFPLQNMLAWVSTFYGEVREQLFAHMRREACLALTGHFDHYFKTRDLQNYTPVIIHGDFGGSNILFEDDRISGILDFSSAGYSDPALDIAAISTYGEPFFRHFSQFYPVSESMLQRARFYRGIFALEEALYGWKNNDKDAFERGMEQYV